MAEESDQDHHVYEAIVARRLQWDSLLWQVPVLSLTAQAFLFTIALDGETRQAGRIVASGLGAVAAVMSMHLMASHRQAEVSDAHWLRDYEKRHFSVVAHGKKFRKRRNSTKIGLWDWVLFRKGKRRTRSLDIWMAGLALFGLAALFVLGVAIVSPDLLANQAGGP